jgi:uncharacterized protein (TIGR02996 family)
MTTGDALFAALLADPTDVYARLVYADWLDEDGHPWTAHWWRGKHAAQAMAGLAARRKARAERERRGAPCKTCGGDGVHETDTGGNLWQSECPSCKGTGHASNDQDRGRELR